MSERSAAYLRIHWCALLLLSSKVSCTDTLQIQAETAGILAGVLNFSSRSFTGFLPRQATPRGGLRSGMCHSAHSFLQSLKKWLPRVDDEVQTTNFPTIGGVLLKLLKHACCRRTAESLQKRANSQMPGVWARPHFHAQCMSLCNICRPSPHPCIRPQL